MTLASSRVTRGPRRGDDDGIRTRLQKNLEYIHTRERALYTTSTTVRLVSPRHTSPGGTTTGSPHAALSTQQKFL